MKLPEEPQFPPVLTELPDFGNESAMFPIENEVLLDDGVEFFKGTLELVLLCPPRAELTKSPNKFGFFSTIPIPEPEAEEEDQVLPKMSPTMEEVGPEEMPGRMAGWVGAGWWVQEGLLGCHAGLGCWVEENEEVKEEEEEEEED